ncbi:MAG: immunoglobulin domain-containing protein, partial [Chitinispirillaceae bacterium]|nr:immunoglobulin domain-containing protein [Chitinispirillaceae bacterium]
MHRLLPALCVGLAIVLIACACNNPSVDPDTADKARISLVLRSSSSVQSDSAVIDTVGNTVRLGVCLYLTQHIDSTVITVGKSLTAVDTAIVCRKKERRIDTAFYNLSFQSSGTRSVLANAYIGGERRTEWAVIHVVDRPRPNHAPKFMSDTVAVEAHPGDSVILDLSTRCADPDSDAITFVLMPGLPAGDSIAGSRYSFTPGDADTGLFSPGIIAHDPEHASDTLTVAMRVRFVDTFPPLMRLVSPAVDSAVVGVDTVRVSISCTDQSGVASVACSRGSDTFGVSRSDTLFFAGVRNLAADELNEILFVATDSSPAANRCTLAVHIRYDPTLLDSIGPVIIPVSGPDSGTVVPDSVVTITDSIIDPSGIDAVYWTLNGTRAGTMTLLSGSGALYALRDTLTMFGPSRIVVHAVDGATRQNRDSSVIVFEFNLPPAINDTAVSTDRNAAATWTLHARSGDGDSLVWSVITPPGNGTLTGSLPALTFTPATNWAGIDSFHVRVTDGYWSDTARVTVTVVDVPVAPVIMTQPEDAVVRPGQSATFSVTINADVNPAPSFQWKKDGSDIPGATAQTLTLGSIVCVDSGRYTVTISNRAGSVTSQAAFL